MKMVIASVYDKATQAYMRPFYALTVGHAVRLFVDECLNPEAPMYKHPEDFTLFHIGNFTDHDAKLEPIEPVVLQRAHEITNNVETVN